ncbi:unnamed protein product [Paramecium sonneborni]|uniref:Transmembrane protein n=1 Tax=Paramecium sonneborni TaxID=65129 RepID=A0A8S1QV64_9CILI|nr:unnamed protein product [Paramecium sonneborni]
MISIANERHTRQRLNIPTQLNQKPLYSQKKQQIPQQEIVKDLLDRQIEYDKLNKIYIPVKSNNKNRSSQKESKFYSMKEAVREAKIKFLEKPIIYEKLQKNETQYFQQQKNSISLIAQIFRNQKAHLGSKSNHYNQRRNKWNLELMLIITIPTICLLVIILEFMY